MESKICQSCGRFFEKRKKWQDSWDEVKYCSKACQGNKTPQLYMEQILDLLSRRDPGKTICPSEILPDEEKKNSKKMERVRSAARLLAAQRQIQICQQGRVVDPQSFKGPIRLRKS